jgi:hypothetical protein
MSGQRAEAGQEQHRVPDVYLSHETFILIVAHSIVHLALPGGFFLRGAQPNRGRSP